MARDLRKLFEKERKEQGFTMKEGHEDRFLCQVGAGTPQKPSKTKGVFPLDADSSFGCCSTWTVHLLFL